MHTQTAQTHKFIEVRETRLDVCVRDALFSSGKGHLGDASGGAPF